MSCFTVAPAAIWVGASAEGCFVAVTAWMIALLAAAVLLITHTLRQLPPLPTVVRRYWLTAQAVLALLLNHLLFTGW